MGDYQTECVYRRKKILTKRVHPEWYKRYADTLPLYERVSFQPVKELKEEDAILKALQTPPKQRDRAEELARKLALERATKIKTVLQLLEADPAKMKQKLASVKQTTQTSALKYLIDSDKEEKKTKDKKNKAKTYIQMPEGWSLPLTSKWRLLTSNKIIRRKIKTMHAEMKAAAIRSRWQRAIRMVRAVVRFTSIIANIARTTGDVFKEFQEVMKKNKERDEQSGGLCFDRNYYKAMATGKHLDRESVFTLGMPELYRTPMAIQKAAVSLRFLRSFAAFPAHFQYLLANIGWIIEVPGDKVIIRQGQQAHAFYFLLSGKAVAVKLTGATDYKAHCRFDVVNLFERDGMFGEEGVVERGYRQYTVTSIENCTLLSVNIDDYNRVCLTAPSEDENPDHIRLLSQLDFMRYFPMKKLIDEADGNIILFYFKPGSVVTSRLSQSNYIYVIKSGTCRVLCQVTRQRTSNKRKSMKVVVPALGDIQDMSDKEQEATHEQKQMSGSDDLLTIDSPTRRLRELGGQGSASKTSLLSGYAASRGASRNMMGPEDEEELINRPSKTMKLMEQLKNQWEGEDTIATSIKKMKNQLTVGQPLQAAGSVEKFITAPSRLSKVAINNQVWINLKTLRETDVIGIEDLDLADDRRYEHPKVSVVSDGSEVILLSRTFFMDNASPKMRAHLRARSYILPDDDTLSLELQRLQYWKKFKNHVLRRKK